MGERRHLSTGGDCRQINNLHTNSEEGYKRSWLPERVKSENFQGCV